MRKALATVATLLVVLFAYLLLWPVPLAPVAWKAPIDRGLVDPFAPNKRLQAATAIDLGEFAGPEDATLGLDGHVYVTTESGHVVSIRNRKAEAFVFVGGRPLGIETDTDGSLVVANSYIGLQRVTADGGVATAGFCTTGGAATVGTETKSISLYSGMAGAIITLMMRKRITMAA